MKFYSRLTPPDELNPCYTTLPKNCLRIGNSVLPNCIGYAIARWIEIFGSQYGLVGTDSDVFYDYNRINADVTSSQRPHLGSIACWNGHIAVVEQFNNNSMTISQSHYNGIRFDTEDIDIGADYHGMEFLGFIFPNINISWDNEEMYDVAEYLPDDFYRVRNSWDDAASQVGAFHYLSYAKKCADENNMSVFDPSGRKVY